MPILLPNPVASSSASLPNPAYSAGQRIACLLLCVMEMSMNGVDVESMAGVYNSMLSDAAAIFKLVLQSLEISHWSTEYDT